MGCWCSKSETNEAKKETSPKVKEYSWDKRKTKIEDISLKDLNNESKIRYPGSINGEQFIIENCKKSTIFLLDHIATITIDNSEDCTFIIGPVNGSIFLRNCKNCTCIVACQQFRTRDCAEMEILLCCTTQPIIESSYKMKFGCYQLFYEGLLSQFKSAGLQIFNNTWGKMYDFTPNPDGANWTRLPERYSFDDKIDMESLKFKLLEEEGLNKSCLPKDFSLSFASEDSVVPFTRSLLSKRFDDPCLIVVFAHRDMEDVSFSLIQNLKENSVDLISTKHTKLSTERADSIFGDGKYQSNVEKGAVIALEFDGDNCVENCENAVKSITSDITIYVSSKESSNRDIENFNQSMAMDMS